MIKMFHKCAEWLDSICGVLCIICLTAMVLLTGAQIVCRIWFTALAWSEELTRYLMVWGTFLGASCVYRRSGHISVTVLQSFCPPKVRTGMVVLCHLLCGAFFVAATYYGIEYMQMQSRQLSAALRVPMSRVYMAIPLGFGLMTLYVIDLLLGMIPTRQSDIHVHTKEPA